MARPLGNTTNLNPAPTGLASRPTASGALYYPSGGYASGFSQDERAELAHLRAENGQLHQLCAELEQALQEASQNDAGAELEARVKEYEMLVEEKTTMIADLHQQLQEARSQALEAQTAPATDGENSDGRRGPVPCEEELLALSEDLERERRQLQEDEDSLMGQMREMEVGMARERAEIARQRNDLQRLHSEIRHEIERLERHGTLQSKIEGLKNKLQDATARRGAAPAAQTTTGEPQPSVTQATPLPQAKGTSLMGRLFGK